MELLAIGLVIGALVLFDKNGSRGGINIQIGTGKQSPLQQAAPSSKGASVGGGGGGFGGFGGGSDKGSSGGSINASNDPLANAIDDRADNAFSNADLKAGADKESTTLSPLEQQALYDTDPDRGGMFGPEDASGGLSDTDTGGFSNDESFGIDDWSMDE